MAQLQFWFDFSCPYAYVASTTVEALSRRTGAELDARPMLLGGVFRARATPQVPAAIMGSAKAKHNAEDIRRTAAWHGVPLTVPAQHPMRTVDALRALLAVGPPYLGPLAHALFRAYWVEGIDIATRDGLARVLRDAGHDPDRVIAESQSDRIKDELRKQTDQAIAAGVFGAPAYVVEGQLYWGVDRSDYVERALGGAPVSDLPDRERMAPTDFWFDYSSPFSYLAAERVERIFGRAASWRPMLLGAVFKTVEQVQVPLFSQNEAKQKHTQADLQRQAEAYGLEVRWPSRFPMNSVLALRVTLLTGGRTDSGAPHLSRLLGGGPRHLLAGGGARGLRRARARRAEAGGAHAGACDQGGAAGLYRGGGGGGRVRSAHVRRAPGGSRAQPVLGLRSHGVGGPICRGRRPLALTVAVFRRAP